MFLRRLYRFRCWFGETCGFVCQGVWGDGREGHYLVRACFRTAFLDVDRRAREKLSSLHSGVPFYRAKSKTLPPVPPGAPGRGGWGFPVLILPGRERGNEWEARGGSWESGSPFGKEEASDFVG